MKAALVVFSVLALATALAAPAAAAETVALESVSYGSLDACTVDIGLVKVCGLCVHIGVNVLCVI